MKLFRSQLLIVSVVIAVEAFVACGGNRDRTGNVTREELTRIVKDEFGLATGALPRLPLDLPLAAVTGGGMGAGISAGVSGWHPRIGMRVEYSARISGVTRT